MDCDVLLSFLLTLQQILDLGAEHRKPILKDRHLLIEAIWRERGSFLEQVVFGL